MGAQPGRKLLIKIYRQEQGYETLAGLRSRRISFNANTVDITHSASPGAWRQLLPEAGVKSAEITGSGIFLSQDTDMLAWEWFFEQTLRQCKLIMPEWGLLKGNFLLRILEYAGEHGGEVTYHMGLVSAGNVAFEASL